MHSVPGVRRRRPVGAAGGRPGFPVSLESGVRSFSRLLPWIQLKFDSPQKPAPDSGLRTWFCCSTGPTGRFSFRFWFSLESGVWSFSRLLHRIQPKSDSPQKPAPGSGLRTPDLILLFDKFQTPDLILLFDKFRTPDLIPTASLIVHQSGAARCAR